VWLLDDGDTTNAGNLLGEGQKNLELHHEGKAGLMQSAADTFCALRGEPQFSSGIEPRHNC
jgi:hypothetical protein